MSEEEWAEVTGFPNYAVSTHGRVTNVKLGGYLRPRVDSYGRHRVTLRRDGESHDRAIKQLVAAAFITGYFPGVGIKHFDGDSSNNRVDNLRFRGGNRLGRLVKEPERPTVRRIVLRETGAVFRNVADLARHIGSDRSSVYKVLRGDRPSHRGYSFEYLEER